MAAEFNWVFDSSKPIVPTSSIDFGGVFDPQLLTVSAVNHVAELLHLYYLEASIVNFIDSITNSYIKGVPACLILKLECDTKKCSSFV